MLKDKRELFGLARKAIHARLYNKKLKLDEKTKSRYSQKEMVFVTVRIDGQLRGSRGTLEPAPLWQGITEQAVNAAFHDTGFIPLTVGEYPDIKLEIEVIKNLEEITGPKAGLPKKIKIGKDGLIVQKGSRGGILLPDVFIEGGTTPVEALEMVCLKAHLKEDDWKSKDCTIFRFTTEEIKEEEE